MGLTAKETGGRSYDPIAEGMHDAICCSLYDLGTQYTEKYNKYVHKVLIMWELPDERIEIEKDGEKKNFPRGISKQYTLSLHEKAQLRKDLESWRGKSFTDKELEGFNLQKLLKINCTLQVIHKKKSDKNYANIVSIVPLHKGTQRREPENTIKYFSFEEHSDQIPEGTPEWIADIIKASNEWEEFHSGSNVADDIPYSDTPPPDDDNSLPF